MNKAKRIISLMLCFCLLFSMVGCKWFDKDGDNTDGPDVPPGSGDENTGGNTGMIDLTALTVNSKKIPMKLWYDEEAPFINECSPEASMMAGQDIGWQNWSLPLGNGFFGANVFGRVETERVQISEKTLANPWQQVKVTNGVTSWPQVAGLNNFSETYIDFDHKKADVSNYERVLDLNNSVATTDYDYNGAHYRREYFVSYPDKVLVIRLEATDGPLSFTLRPTIPFEQKYMNEPGDGLGKSGNVKSIVAGGVGYIELCGKLEYYDVDFAGYYRVYTDGGDVTAETTKNSNGETDGTIRVEGASSAVIIASFATDYELCAGNFENGQYSHDKPTSWTDLDDARIKVESVFEKIDIATSDKTPDELYKYLKDRHFADYNELYGRVNLELDCDEADYALTTDKLLEKYNNGSHSSYLEALLFQYGRYLIIASSREGSLPANLQGVWNCYNFPAWTSGYWSNINIQMNYWHVFSTNLKETFIPYVDYNSAYMPLAEKNASNLIATHNPAVFNKDGGNGWTMGVSGNPFFISSDRSCGNLGLLTQLFYDYYEFTRDEAVLKQVYQVLANAARFVTKCVKDYDGVYLVEYCDSPEMYVDGVWYYTTGTTYAQTLAYINNYGALQCAKALGIDLSDTDLLSSEEYSILGRIMEQLDKYDPINVGLSGQIKEFREEDYYSSLGNPNHRHISQLVGLFPGNLINSQTGAWMDAALVSLAGRNEGLVDWPNGTTAQNEASIVAWSWAHKQAMYARAGEGDMAQEMLRGNLRNSTLENLLMVCGKIFQIEASSGTTAAIAEMLLQSDEEYIEILPAIPTNWSKGSYTGLVARGNFEVDVSWVDGVADKINLRSAKGGRVSLKYPCFYDVKVYDSEGKEVEFTLSDDKMLSFDTVAGGSYYVSGFKKVSRPERPATLGFERVGYGDFKLTFNKVEGAVKYNVYVAYENDASYSFVGSTTDQSFILKVKSGKENVRKTFAVTAVNSDGIESKRTLCYSNPESLDIVLYSLAWSNTEGKLNVSANANENAASVRLYAKDSESDSYKLVAEADGLTISVDYDASKLYALSAVAKFTGKESAKMPLTVGNHISNILINKEFVPDQAAVDVILGEGYGYPSLTDCGEFSSSEGRFATSIKGSRFAGALDLGAVYRLGELRLYVYKDASYAGQGLKVEVLNNGEWNEIISLQTNDEIAARLVDGATPYLAFDMNGALGSKIRITIENGVSDKSISFHEITLSGEYEGNISGYENVFIGKKFDPSTEAAGNIYNSSYGYDTLTDGIIFEESRGRFSSKLKGGKVEATIDLGGVYNLSEMKVYLYKDGISKLGTGITVELLYNGAWTTVASCSTPDEILKYFVDNPGGVGDFLIFSLGDRYASKVRFSIPAQTDSGWTTLYEIECLGVKTSLVDDSSDSEPKPEEQENILSGKQFIPTAEAKAEVLVASWFNGGGYEALTDGMRFEDQVGRFSTKMNNTTAFMDATVDLGGNYTLSSIRFYIYDAQKSNEQSKKASIGKDIIIQVYSDGVWTDIVVCADNESLSEHLVILPGLNNDYLEFDLQNIVAEKLRFYISGAATADGITYQEIECYGVKAD